MARAGKGTWFFHATARHGYEAWGYEAKAKPKLWLDHEAEAEALPFLNHEAEAESEAQVFGSY